MIKQGLEWAKNQRTFIKMEKQGLGRKLLFTLASFLIVGTSLILHFHVPFVPVLFGGLLAFVLVLAPHFPFKR